MSICWRAWRCDSNGSKLRSAEEILREERAARVNAKRLAAGWQRYIHQRRTQSVTRASEELLDMAEGLRAADRDMTEALRVAEQAVGNLLERNEEVTAMGVYMGQCIQSLEWQALQREIDYELASTGSTSTSSVYSSNKVDKLVQTILTSEDMEFVVKMKEEDEEWPC